MIPFTYCITNRLNGKRYYGCRYSKNCHPSQLGVSYFSHSKDILNIIKNAGIQNLIFEIRKCFDDPIKCRNWEAKVLRRLKAAQNGNWYNRSNGNKNFYCVRHSEQTRDKMRESHIGYIHSEETKEKISNAHSGRVGRPWSANQRILLIASHTGQKRSEESKKRMSASQKNRSRDSFLWTNERKLDFSKKVMGTKNSFYGKTHSVETRNKMKNATRPQVACIYCGLISLPSQIKRWHNDNCKNKPI